MTELTPVALWLNSTFAGIDNAILSAFHAFASAIYYALNPIFSLIGKIGEGGACFIAFAVILLFFKKTRKAGICILLALLIGALITNLTLKGAIARPRPYVTSELYKSWWLSSGSYGNADLSFPSGHATAATAAMTAWFLSRKSGKAFACALAVAVIFYIDRLYLIVHYPSDIAGGIIVGIFAGIVAYLIVSAISKAIKKRQQLTNN
jgi:membrane-associated phospholipid phosphatase